MQTAKTMSLDTRELTFITSGQPANDGAGVKLTRVIGSPELNTLDPFLLLDVFQSDENADYVGGFPSHPHRGFETVTYLLHGRIRHKDNAGHEGVIESGGVQWMTAGKGIVHSEMPEQEQGLLHGFQLWLNLPAAHKLTAPAYQEFSHQQLPIEIQTTGAELKVIAGVTDQGTKGPVVNHFVHPRFFDVALESGQAFQQTVSSQDNVMVYVIRGHVFIGDADKGLNENQLGILQQGNQVKITSDKDARFLFLSAKPLDEPIARGGPFVMNTREEVLQAFDDFENNRF